MAPPLTDLLRQLHRLATPPGDDSDADLLGRFVRRGDEPAFAALLARHGPMVHNVCRRLLGDRHAAEDAFQATFLVLARRAAALRRPAALAGWLYAVAYRVALRARAGLARRRAARLPQEEDTAPDPHPDPLAQVSARELLCAVEEEVQRLPAAYRLPVALCCLEGLSQEEAARRLGCTAGSVKGRLERGRQRLRQQLQHRGLTLTAALAAAALSRTSAAAARRFVTGPAGGATSVRAAALAQGVLRMMLFQRLGSVAAVVALGAASLVAGALCYDRLAAQPPAIQKPAAAGPQAGTPAQGPPVWAALSVSPLLFQEGGQGGPRVTFALVNDGDRILDPKISSSKLLVNGKALPNFLRGEVRFRSLKPGEHLLFSVTLSEAIQKPGVYRLSWEGEGFRAAQTVFRVLPGNAGEAGQQGRREHALTLRQLGELHQQSGRSAEAAAAYRQAAAMLQKLVLDFPSNRAYRTDLAGSLNRLAALQHGAEAEATLRQALALLEKAVAEAPQDPAPRRELARNYRQLSQVMRDTGRLAEAEALLRRALAIQQSLQRDDK
jgi:RNA polymerase sigma factor (sigma-70 family)